jgi:hypothetical protein
MSLPLDPFGRTAAPAGFTREDRVRLIGAAAEALLHGRLPDPPARLFLAGAIIGWLQRGGSLEGDFFRVTAPAGSHLTPSKLWLLARNDVEPDSGQDAASSLDQ